MKIHLLPIGAQFEWKGQVFTKTGPMTACTEKGGSVFVPKHATLRPLAGAPEPTSETPTTLDANEVHSAFETYHALAKSLVSVDDGPKLDDARRQFLTALGLS